MQRRHFLTSAFATAATVATSQADHPAEKKDAPAEKKDPLFKISLAQWSNHRLIFSKKITNLGWPDYVQKTYGISGLEFVNQFFKDKARNVAYLRDLKRRVENAGSTSLLIMVDGEGHMGADTEAARQKTVDNHKKWVDAAKFLGCHSIRVNSYTKIKEKDVAAKHCVDGLQKLSQYAAGHDINVIVENHGGLSSDGAWMAGVLKDVGMENCGSLPDFGNFHGYDRYQGIKDLMPFAKGVSAKSREFNEAGDEVQTNFEKAMKIVLEHNYHGWVGVEFEGNKHSEDEGVKLTKALLEKVRNKLQA